MINRRDALKSMAGMTATLAAAGAQGDEVAASHAADIAPAAVRKVADGGIVGWLASTMFRVYPSTTPDETAANHAGLEAIHAVRHFRFSFQVCVRNEANTSAQIECAIAGMDGLNVRIRRVGLVPVHHLDTYVPLGEYEGIGKLPGLCPDPLFPEPAVHIGPKETASFWISVYVPADARVGKFSAAATLKLTNRFGYQVWDNPPAVTLTMPVEVSVGELVLKRRENFPATVWLSADSIWEHYKVEPCGEPFWKLVEPYIQNLVDHGIDVSYAPIFNIRAEKLKRPAQLLRVKKTAAGYAFDFTDVRRWIRLAKTCGAKYIEFSHFFSPAPNSAEFPQKIYERGETIGELLWPENTPATGDIYRNFLKAFLPELKKVLEEEEILDHSLFHLADEPDGAPAVARYRQARELMRELAPWMKFMDAMSDPHFAIERLSDMPVPSIATASAFAAAGCPAWVYYCCGPRDGFIQRLLDTPLWKIRYSGMLFYKLKARGFLHWGYNYWFHFCTDQIADPYADATNGFWPGMPYGDTFAVYPGPAGPIDSIRWEIFAESLQDYALLQARDISPDDSSLAELKDYNAFPKNAQWIENVLRIALTPKASSDVSK